MVRKYQKFQNFSRRKNSQGFCKANLEQLQSQQTAQGDQSRRSSKLAHTD